MTPSALIQSIRKVYKVDLTDPSRETPYIMSRHIFHYLMRKYSPRMTLKAIGSHTGKDHATVIHSIKVIQNFLATSAEVRTIVAQIESDTGRNFQIWHNARSMYFEEFDEYLNGL